LSDKELQERSKTNAGQNQTETKLEQAPEVASTEEQQNRAKSQQSGNDGTHEKRVQGVLEKLVKNLNSTDARDLLRIIETWPNLPLHIKAAILALIEAAKKQ